MTDLELARDVARRAGALLRNHYQRGLTEGRRIDHKGTVDLVTDSDRASEALVVKALQEARPGDAILAEEDHRDVSVDAERIWIVDPLDGTTNFAHSLPHFAVSIGLQVAGAMNVGVVYAPMADELFAASAGGGATCNGAPIRVSGIDSVSQALCGTGFPYDRRDADDDNVTEWRAFLKVSQGVRRMGSAALDLCAIACGRLDLFWEMRLAAWDVAAGALLVAEAGGRVSGYGGEPFAPDAGHLVATNGLLHADTLEVLARIRSGRA